MLGIDNKSNIVGLKKIDYNDRITKILRSQVEPSPKIRFEERRIDKKGRLCVVRFGDYLFNNHFKESAGVRWLDDNCCVRASA